MLSSKYLCFSGRGCGRGTTVGWWDELSFRCLRLALHRCWILSSSQLNPADSNTSGRKYLRIFSQLHSRLKETAPMVFTVRLTPNKKGSPGTTRLTGGAQPVAVLFCSGDCYPPPKNPFSFETKLREKNLPFTGARGTLFPGWNLSRGSPPYATQRRAHLGVDTDWSRGAALSLCCLRVLSETSFTNNSNGWENNRERVICYYIPVNKTDLSCLKLQWLRLWMSQ